MRSADSTFKVLTEITYNHYTAYFMHKDWDWYSELAAAGFELQPPPEEDKNQRGQRAVAG